MTDKNSPLRVIDQKTVNKTPPPGAQPVKYNPYTGGVIRQSTEPRYKMFLQPSSNWVKIAFSLFRENDNRRGTIQLAVRVPKLVLRMENPNADIQKLRIFLSFEADVFDRYGDEDFVDQNDPNPNLISFVTNIVTHVGANNRGVGNLDISSHIRRLFFKYSFYDLLLASGVDITVAEFRTKSNDELKEIFEGSMANMRVYAQAMFQSLEPDDETSSAPFLFRIPVSCSYTLSPDQLKNADVSDFSVTFLNDAFSIRFTQTSIAWIEFSIHDTSLISGTITEAQLTNSNRVYRTTIDSFPDRLVNRSISVNLLSSRFTKFNDYTAPQVNLNELPRFNSRYTLIINSIRSIAGVQYSGKQIETNYLISTLYTVPIGAYSDSVTTERRHVLNLIDGQREYIFKKSNLAQIGGILLIYRVIVSGNVRYVPRFFPVSSLNQTQVGSELWYSIKDPFTRSSLGKSFGISFNDIQAVDFHLISPIGRVSTHKYRYDFNKVNLAQRLETIFGTPLFDGHYALRFKRSNSLLQATSLVSGSNSLSANGRFQLSVKFNIVVEVNTTGNWVEITPVNFRNRVYELRMISVPGSIRLAWTLAGSSAPVIFADTGVRFVKNTRYRIKLMPIIASSYLSQCVTTNGSFIYFLEFRG